MPATVAGFALGGSREATVASCKDTGHQAVAFDKNSKPLNGTLEEAGVLVCEGEAVETGFRPRFVALTFCESGTLCEAQLYLLRPEADYRPKLQQDGFDHAAEMLTKKYGRPTELEGSQDIPALYRSCSEDHKDVMTRRFWSWPHGGQIILAYSCKGASGKGIGVATVLYQNSEMFAQRLGEHFKKEQNY